MTTQAPTAPANPLAALPPRGAQDAFYILDLSSWARAVYEGSRHKGIAVDHPENDVVVRGVLNRLIDDCFRGRDPAYFAVAADVINDRTGRAEIWPGYQAKRTPPGPGYARQLDVVLRLLELHRIPVLRRPGLEADDFVAALARRARAAGLRVVILSGDHDLWQLMEDHDAGAVVAWDIQRGKVFTTADCQAVYGVAPSLLLPLMALAGDSDEAPGIHGVGEKKAAALVNRHGSLERVLERWAWEKGALARQVREGRDAALLSFRLVRLRAEAPVHVYLADCAVGWGVDDAAAIQKAAVRLGIGKLRDALPLAKPTPTREQALCWDAAGELLAAQAAEVEAFVHRDVKPANMIGGGGAGGGLTTWSPEPGAQLVAVPPSPGPTPPVQPAPAPAEVERPAETAIAAPDAPAVHPEEPWRSYVASHDATVWRTEVRNWTLLVGRWARLRPVRQDAPPVYVRVLSSAKYSDAWKWDTMLFSRALVRCDGREVEASIINAQVDVYLGGEPPCTVCGELVNENHREPDCAELHRIRSLPRLPPGEVVSPFAELHRIAAAAEASAPTPPASAEPPLSDAAVSAILANGSDGAALIAELDRAPTPPAPGRTPPAPPPRRLPMIPPVGKRPDIGPPEKPVAQLRLPF